MHHHCRTLPLILVPRYHVIYPEATYYIHIWNIVASIVVRVHHLKTWKYRTFTKDGYCLYNFGWHVSLTSLLLRICLFCTQNHNPENVCRKGVFRWVDGAFNLDFYHCILLELLCSLSSEEKCKRFEDVIFQRNSSFSITFQKDPVGPELRDIFLPQHGFFSFLCTFMF